MYLISHCKLTSSILFFFIFFLSPHPPIASRHYYLMIALCETFCCQVFMSREGEMSYMHGWIGSLSYWYTFCILISRVKWIGWVKNIYGISSTGDQNNSALNFWKLTCVLLMSFSLPVTHCVLHRRLKHWKVCKVRDLCSSGILCSVEW